jgi:ABC-type phosphonate transport system ATPase subunit
MGEARGLIRWSATPGGGAAGPVGALAARRAADRRHVGVGAADRREAWYLAHPQGERDADCGSREQRVERRQRYRGRSSRQVLPRLTGIATPLGRAFLDGTELSGGQWQKLALGRSMMRERPLVLALDEPAYSSDVESERRVFEWFSRVASADSSTGTITLIVSYRFSSVRAADVVVVMHEGRVVETGSHRELMARGGRYAAVYRTQAEGYQ